MRKFFLTVGYSGLSPFAPGTVGTIVSVPFALLILEYFPPSTLMLLATLITVISIKQIDLYEIEVGEHDSKEIVIDELVGVWIALAFAGSNMIMILFSVILFRLFDIWKPSVIGRIDKEVSGGKGVMFDDVLAGIFAGLCSALLYQGYLLY